MKKRFLVLLAIIGFGTFVSAQEFHYGAKVGGDLGTVTGSQFKSSYGYGLQAGAFLEYNFTKKIGVQPELLFNQVNITPENSNTSSGYFKQNGQSVYLNYLSLPVLLRINTSQLLTIQIGPEFSKMIGGNPTYINNGEPIKALKTNNIAGVLGIQLNLQKWIVDARYEMGLSNINTNNQYTSKSREFALNLGYRIF